MERRNKNYLPICMNLNAQLCKFVYKFLVPIIQGILVYDQMTVHDLFLNSYLYWFTYHNVEPCVARCRLVVQWTASHAPAVLWLCTCVCQHWCVPCPLAFRIFLVCKKSNSIFKLGEITHISLCWQIFFVSKLKGSCRWVRKSVTKLNLQQKASLLFSEIYFKN